jgi:hypothetical protein
MIFRSCEHALRLPRQRRVLYGRHPEPRARVHPVRLKFSRRQADDRLLRLQLAIIIAAG